uniref:Uncharacterized protein n=1 Tax=Ciona intestinalis TaxID=7719 RepID=H2XWK6_CIOIN
MWFSDLVSPVTTSNRDDGELGECNRSTNSGCYFLGTFDTQTNMPVGISNSNKSLVGI